MRSKSVANLTQQDPEDDVLLPPPDYSDNPARRNSTKSLIQTHVPSSENTASSSFASLSYGKWAVLSITGHFIRNT